MKITENKFLYVWHNPETGMDNVGKKVSSKNNYVSSASSYKFWRDWSSNKLEQFCLVESDEEEVLSASEWWALDYGIKVRGIKKFYNVQNNAHRGDQSLVTPEIKARIVAYFNNELLPEPKNEESFSIAENIINKVEAGFYPVTQVPVFDIAEYQHNQVREVSRNVDNEDKIIQRYIENPQRVKDSVTPMTVMVSKNGNKTIVNGHTRLGAAMRCTGWNTLPVVFVQESEFGETQKEINQNVILAGSYANREQFISVQENKDEDILMQMTNLLAIEGIDISLETAREYAREFLITKLSNTVPSRSKLVGLTKRLFNNFDKTQANLEVQANLKTYSDSDLRKYCYEKYESKGIAAIVSTFTNMTNMQALGFVFNHTLQFNKAPAKLAIVLHFRTKHEYQKEQSEKRAAALQKIIKNYKLPVVVDVLKAFE